MIKLRKLSILLALCVAAGAYGLAGCSGGPGANVVTISVNSTVGNPGTLILGQATIITATLSGATNTNVNWLTVQYTTTTISSSGTPSTSNAANIPSDGTLGALSNQLATGTATYTAPLKVPDQTKYPGLQIIVTVQSQQDTSQTAKETLSIDSGIAVTLTPTTASVPTKEQQLFSVALTNDLQSQGVSWLLTQQTPTGSQTYPTLTTCSPTCGSVTPQGLYSAVYTAPSAVPTASTPSGASTTPASLTIVATAKADVTRIAIGTVTVTAGGPITFNSINPTIAPQGGALWDIYLDAPNISSASLITLTDSNGGQTTLTSASGQVKVLFPIPTTTVTNPTSIGARIRLTAANLAAATTITISVADPAEPVTPGSGPFTYAILPVRPTSVSTVPNSVLQGTLTGQTTVSIDGGYFGPNGQLANVLFAGNTIPLATNSQGQSLSGPQRLAAQFPTAGINSGSPGLYPLSVSRTTPPLPTSNNPSVTTIAVFPDYSTNPPQVVSSVTAGTNPSAIDIDPILGVVAVAETGSNAVQFYSVGSGSLTPLGSPVAVGQTPTGISVNASNHSVAVVNYGSQSVSVLPIPGAPNPVTPETIDISGVLQGVASPAPLPYSIGVDPDTNLALVAYSSTSVLSAANVGFVVNLNQGANAPFGCMVKTNTPPCVYAQVTLNTGAYPQIAVNPHGHIAYVTPGGQGIMSGIDVTQPSSSVGISNLQLTSGIVTATTTATLTGLNPGNPGSVLISGVPGPNTQGNPTTANFNGVFAISVTGSNSFTYAINSLATGTATGGTVFYGAPAQNFAGISQTSQGIAINPVTNSAVLADANATGQNGAPQLNILNQLDQSINSIFFFATCTAYSPTCSNSAELLGTTDVAWQPYVNSIVSYNPEQNQVSVSDPVTQTRRALINMPTNTAGSANILNNSLELFGGLAVDPATNQAFVVQSGSGSIQVLSLGSGSNNIKPTQITTLLVPSANPSPQVVGGIPNAFFPDATLTSTSDLAGVQLFGSGFAAGAQVRLDGVPVPAGNVNVVNSRELIVTIPASFLSLPHRYALDVISSGVQSNPVDFFVVKAVDMTPTCSSGPPQPNSVAIADQLLNGPFSPMAVVTNTGCNNISTIDINPASATFGTVMSTIAVGNTPEGVAVSEHFGLAAVVNNGGNSVSVVNLTSNPPKEAIADVTVGTSPAGIAIDEETGVALVANTQSNSVSEINLSLLFGSSPATSLTASTIGGVQDPIAVAIDPDRGTNNQGLAVVTGISLLAGQASAGSLFPIDIGLASPSLSTTITPPNVTSTPTSIVFNPAVVTGTANPGVFYVNSSGGNVITSFNPDSGSAPQVPVGINPTALAVNPQTGAILTSNFAGKSASIVDTLSNPIRTVQTLGLPGSEGFGVAIDQFTNLAVVVDSANNRVLLMPMPN